jgi:predicted NBD/HSP70 family sugar kinase
MLENDELTLGMDLGGTSLFFRLEARGRLLTNGSMATSQDFSTQLKDIYENLVREFGVIHTVSLGVPGPVKDNVMGPSFPLGTQEQLTFERCFKGLSRLIVKNDLFMALAAEMTQGHGVHHRNVVLVSISTGIGTAVAFDGVPLEIRSEMGHQRIGVIGTEAAKCINHSNCWASMCSGKAMSKKEGSLDLDLIRSANLEAFINITAAYDPEVIVVMGGVGVGLFDQVSPTQGDLAAEALLGAAPLILKTKLGDDIGAIGAVKLARSAWTEDR